MKRKAARIVLLSSLIMGASVLPTYAETTSGDLSGLQNRLRESESVLSQKEEEKQQLQKEIDQFKQQIQQFDEEMKKTQEELDTIQKQIEETKELIVLKSQNIDELQTKIQQRQEVIKKRLIALQSQPKSNLVADVLIQTKSIANLLDNVYSLSLIFQSDESIIKTQQADQEKLEKEKISIANKEAALRSYEASLQEKQQQLENSQQEKVAAIKELEQKLNQTLADIMDKEEEQKLLESQAAALSTPPEQKTSKETVASSESSTPAPATSPAAGSKIFIWPSAGTVTSGFGMRGSENHKGIDIAASGTVPVVASAAGTVIRSEYSSSYGNVVYISHSINGKTYTTLYAHLRSRSVQAGQAVQQGQQIGIMGNTGISFGQHVHFEVHAGSWNAAKSNAVDPMSFLK
ncbi:MAG: murein hydrolase activator EnvC [Ectobacillus sp.]